MYIELPFGIVIASRDNVVFVDSHREQTGLLRGQVSSLTIAMDGHRNSLRDHECELVRKSVEIGRLEASSDYYRAQLEDLLRENRAYKQENAALEIRLARLESRDANVTTPGDISQGLAGIKDMDAVDMLNQKLAAAGLIDPNAIMRDPRASMLTGWSSQQDGSTVLAQAIGNSWNLPGEDLPVQDTQGLAHDLARDEDLDY